MKKIILLLIPLFILLIWNFLQPRTLLETNKVNVGVLSPMSGNSADYGKKCQKAIFLSQSLFDNNQTHLIFEDTQASPKKGILATQKLIKRDDVVAIIGGILSSVTIPTAQISERNKVIQIATTSSSPKITNLGDFIYRVWPRVCSLSHI